jgi:hypothetical protein
MLGSGVHLSRAAQLDVAKRQLRCASVELLSHRETQSADVFWAEHSAATCAHTSLQEEATAA